MIARMRAIRAKRASDGVGDREAGAVLVLVLVFLLVGAVIVGALATAATSDLHNSGNFASSRTDKGNATSAINSAIASIRYTPLLGTNQTLNASPPGSCFATGKTQVTTSDGSVMSVWCSTAWNPALAATRVVTLSSCAGGADPKACAANPMVQAQVTFDDYPTGTAIAASNAACFAYCGTSMTINNWAVRPIMPAVTGISPATGPITGGTQVTISGTGFVAAGTTVNFVEESGGAPASDNTVLAASSVTVNTSGTQITAVAPLVTEGATYYVTVRTPTGTSAYASNAVFVYTQVNPTATNVTSPGGQTNPGGGSNGGTAVTIYGSGFYSGDTVNFVEATSSYQPVSPVVSVPANFVAVSQSPTVCTQGPPPCLTAVSPAVTVGSTYLVTVTSPSGFVAQDTRSDGSGSFSYSVYVPIVTGISPSSSASLGGGPVTINGTGFFSGATVCFNPSSSGSSCPSGDNVSPASLSATQITVNPPAGLIASPSSAATYYVQVTTPGGTSQPTSTAVFSYVPTVTSISPTSGSTGTTVTINGTNFVSSGIQVAFVQVSGSKSATATNVTVSSTTKITVKAPTVTHATQYYVVVTTLGGSSATSLSDIFTGS
jgi:IPT/TIG domain